MNQNLTNPVDGKPIARSDLFRLDGQTAVITGGAQGIGKTAALFLADFGANVVIADLNQETAESTAVEIKALGVDSLAIKANVTVKADMQRVVDTVVERFGRIDILINSAGINVREPALEVSEENWRRILDVNLTGLFLACQAAGRVMVQQGYGRIINIASHMAKIAWHLRAAYCASKGGVAQLTKELAIEWAANGVTVNAIAPSFFLTPMNEPLFADPEMSAFISSNTPVGRPGNTDELGSSLLFLASPGSSYITGHLLLVDGGYTSR